jgi:apolipoprotein N-acyltransferase
VLNPLLALLSGAVLFLIHPRASLWWLAPVALLPLLLALARARQPHHRFLLGYAAGLVQWAGLCYWIEFVMAVHGRMGHWAGAGAFLLFLLLRALHMGCFGLLAGPLLTSPFALVAIPALWVLMERIPSFFGFMWLALGNVAVDLALPMRLAPLTGVWGLSFLLALFSTALFLLITQRNAVRLRRLTLAAVALCAAILWLLPPLPEADPPQHQAVLLQPNIPAEKVWTWEEARALQQRLVELSRRATLSGRAVRLILWPEVPAPLYYYEDAVLRQQLALLTRSTQTPLILGTVAQAPSGAPLNSALLIDRQGQPAGRYDKVNLVPFGEYVPPAFGFVNRVTQEIGDFAPGSSIVVLKTPEHAVGVFICYESAFPHFVRQFAAHGAQLLANLSNDGYFGDTAARQQHLWLVRMRAAETGRWILRATNDGVSAAIDPSGRIRQALPERTQAALRVGFATHTDQTLYVRWGDWFLWLCLPPAVLPLLTSLKRRAGLKAHRLL